MLLRTALTSGLSIIAGSLVLISATDGCRAFTTESARRLAVARAPVEVPDVVLQDQVGESFRLAELRGRWVVVEFVYTRCETLCLALGSELAQLETMLATAIAEEKVSLLSISFDRERDTPAQLASYLRRMRSRGTGWRAARTTDAAGLDRLKRAFGITVLPDGTGGFVHNAAIHLVDPDGRLVRIVDLGEGATLARELARRLER